jgi:hypothetical protein
MFWAGKVGRTVTNSMGRTLDEFSGPRKLSKETGKLSEKNCDFRKLFPSWTIYPGGGAFVSAPKERLRPMSMIEKIPTMSDEDVINLLTNARRLQEVGDERQQAAAAELLPVLEEVAAERRAARQEAIQAKRAATKKPKKAAAAAEAEAA